jgi:hypothetical protein
MTIHCIAAAGASGCDVSAAKVRFCCAARLAKHPAQLQLSVFVDDNYITTIIQPTSCKALCEA